MEELIKEVNNIETILKRELPVFSKGKKKVKKGLYFGKNIIVEPNVYFDTTLGEIVIGDGTKIKAGSVLRGPLLLGNNCVVNSFTEMSASKIGNVCKLGGEIDHVIMQDYSNKQHYGYLGHSYIGSWVNIGGGTSIATLKNNYGNIKVAGLDTGIQFFGCIMGDYVKTAINTSIFCGKVIGPSAHLYGTVTEDVPAFTSHIRPGIFYELPFELALDIQKAMAKRRNFVWTEKDSTRFKKLFDLTAPDRKKVKAKKGKLTFK